MGGPTGLDEAQIYVLLPVHNRRAMTERFMESLERQTDRNHALIVIDDGSSDGTADMVRERDPAAVVIRGDGNLWWAGSLQRGVDWLRSSTVSPESIVLLINDDTEFGPEFLSHARIALEGRDRTLLQAQLCGPDSGACITGVRVDWARLTFEDILDGSAPDCLSTRGLFLRMGDLRDIGGFHPRSLPHYLSDYEYTLRAARTGFALTSDPRVRIEHGPISGSLRSRQLGSYLRATFSKRSPANPVYWSMFLLLACPRRKLPMNLARVWIRFIRDTGRVAFARGVA